jgi:hypothetical protein
LFIARTSVGFEDDLMMTIRRRTFLTMALVLWPTAGLAADPDPLAEAMGALAREKSAAEQYAVVLATVGKKDMATYLRGISLYAEAKAEFDGLIAQLVTGLRDGHDPTTSEAFKQALQRAAEKRIAFTTFVTNDVIGKIEGAKPGLPAIIVVAPELIKAITDAGLSIWTAFHKVGKEKQDEILGDLERVKWRPFAALAPS